MLSAIASTFILDDILIYFLSFEENKFVISFVSSLKSFCCEGLHNVFISSMNSGKKQELNNIEKEMEKIAARKEKIENEYMDNKISSDKYNMLLDRCENDLLRLQIRRESLTVETKESLENLRSALLVHKTVTHLYKDADVRGKKEIIGSIFKDFLVFEK